MAVPFTSPILGGTRARLTPGREVELIVPNLSGGNGIYIVPWKSLVSFGRPTLHDKILNAKIAVLKSITPATVRLVAREVAAEGLAGEEAVDAARIMAERDKQDRLVTNNLLLASLIRQANDGSAGPLLTGDPGTPEMKEQVKSAIAMVAPRVGQTPAWVTTALRALPEVMDCIGIGSAKTAAGRVPRTLAMLRTINAEIADWSATQRADDLLSYAATVCSVADFTLALAGELLGKAYALTNNLAGLLRIWASDQSAVIRFTGRPEWLLDGWEQIGNIWNSAGDDMSRRAALAEIAGFVPILPKEAEDWRGPAGDGPSAPQIRQMIRMDEGWRTGEARFALIARNERFRAAIC